MKILFIVWDLSRGNDANINIGKIVSNELITSGHKVYMLGKYESKVITQIQFSDNINYRYIETNKYQKERRIIDNDKKREYFLSDVFKKISFIPKYILEKIKQRKILDNYVRKIEEICKKEEIDVAIAISIPFITSIALASANIKSKKVIYQLDPHFSHYKNKMKRKILREEIDVINSVDVLVVTRLIYHDNKTNKLSPYVFKMCPIDFPNIRPLLKTKDINNIIFDKRYINCIFVGNLYRDIRSADYLLRVFKEMKNDRLILHCIGGGDTEQLYDFKEILGERLIIHGVVNYERAINAMIDADILINIGNTISNQMPSKIFDYINTGKPILNFVKINNCPTLEYTIKYPLCLNIFESRKLTNDVIQEIEDFCIENKGYQIDYDLIKRIYNDCTVGVVVNKLMNIINKVVD